MRVLFLHQNFPGQFVHLARALQRAGNEVRAIADAANPRPDLVPTLRYRLDERNARRAHHLARSFESRVSRAETVAATMRAMRATGFNPDLVIGHVGWGETLFVKDVWPMTKLIVHAEYYYAAEGADTNFDPEFRASSEAAREQERYQIKVRNAAILLALADADFGVSPTQWQGSRFPTEFRSKIAILHEGIDTQMACPAEPGEVGTLRLKQANGEHLVLNLGDEIVTFVNRNLEPYRGYHTFMRALPEILRTRSRVRVVIVGGQDVSYGAAPPKNTTWKQLFLDEVRHRIDLNRVHFVGRIAHTDLIRLFQRSSVHVYLTYPFVLSWSLLDAMSAGAIVVASRTAPVEEVIEDRVNGILTDFFDANALSFHINEVLKFPERYKHLKIRSRKTVIEKYDLEKICLPQWLSFVDAVVAR